MTQGQELLVTNNVKLAYWVMKNKIPRQYSNDEDMEGVALQGLVEAALTFNVDYGVKFGTYAYRCIVRRLMRAVEHRERPGSRIVSDAIQIGEGFDSEYSPSAIHVPIVEAEEHDFLAGELMERVIRKALKLLPKTHRSTLEKRFGLVGNEMETQRNIAAGEGVSKERIRQVQYEAMYFLKQLFEGNMSPEMKPYEHIPKSWLAQVMLCVQVRRERRE